MVHPYLGLDLREKVEALVKKLNSDDFEEREAAHRRLEELGRTAFGSLARLKMGQGLETTRRLERLMEKYEAREFANPKAESK